MKSFFTYEYPSATAEGSLLYYVLRSPFAEGSDVVDGDVDEAGAGFVGCPGDMGRDKGIRAVEQGMISLGGLLGEHVGAEGS